MTTPKVQTQNFASQRPALRFPDFLNEGQEILEFATQCVANLNTRVQNVVLGTLFQQRVEKMN